MIRTDVGAKPDMWSMILALYFLVIIRADNYCDKSGSLLKGIDLYHQNRCQPTKQRNCKAKIVIHQNNRYHHIVRQLLSAPVACRRPASSTSSLYQSIPRLRDPHRDFGHHDTIKLPTFPLQIFRLIIRSLRLKNLRQPS